MNIYTFAAVHNITAIAAGVYLATHNSPWLAVLCFLLVKTIEKRVAK